MPLLLLLTLGLIPLTWLIGEPLYRRWQQRRLARRPFPAVWRSILMRRVPLYRRLPTDLQLQLKRRIQVFLAQTPFIGCAGQPITDEVRVTIAAHACLLLLNRRRWHFPRLRQVLVYPGAFVVERMHHARGGVLQEQRQVLSGESWSQGQVILSWQDVLEGAEIVDDGRNVALHEFAHQLDQETGSANGAPWLGSARRHARWARVFSSEFARLRATAAQGLPTLLNAYGASDPAEFFAVATEVFFEQAPQLAAQCPALYRELSDYYRIDPLSW
jgi:hypothetical protein